MTVRQSGTLAELPPRHNSDGRSPKQGLGCRPTGQSTAAANRKRGDNSDGMFSFAPNRPERVSYASLD